VKTLGKLYYIRYFIDTKNDSIVIATTRPETIFADVAVAVHPQDKRYKKLIGKKVLIPIINRSIPIIGDEAVEIGFGTGALKITPTHDATDFEIAKRHNLPMDVFAFDKQGRFTHHAGESFAGKEIDKFFDNIVNFLDDIGNLVKIEEHEMTIPYSEKGKVRIQPMLSKQWFVDVKEYAEQAYAMIESGEVTVHPEKFKETFYDRLGKIRPRCISRQLWRGHRIPVRYTPDGKPHIFDEDTILERMEGSKKGTKKILLSLILFNLIADSRLPHSFNIEQLIGLLYTPSLTPQHGSVGQVYLSIYAEKFKDNKELLKELNELQEIINADVKDTEKVSKIIDLLEETFAIKQE
jgi:valyl-tRNA synthetase